MLVVIKFYRFLAEAPVQCLLNEAKYPGSCPVSVRFVSGFVLGLVSGFASG